ncbi:hypothetical protein KQ944_05555 [Bacillus subtilis]|nr:hypothetical protein [Bacillus subtilis]
MSGHVLSADIIVSQNIPKFDERRWRVIVSPYIWAASLNGHANILGRRTDIDVPFSDIFKNLDFSAMGNVEVTNGQWGVYFDGQYTKTSQSMSFHSQTLGADIISTSLSAGAFWRLYEMPLSGETVFGGQQLFAFEPTVGLRWTQLKVDFMFDRWSESRKLQWTYPFVGARMQTDLNDRWNFFAEADIGGFGAGTDLSAQGQAYLGYRTHILNQPALLRFGYRALYQNYDGGDVLDHRFKWNVTQHGPVAGISLVF